jgi:choline dehydrogenase-like flavoprotein
MAQSLTMPGWFADHFGNMRNYHRMMCVGALFGSENTGQVSVPRLGPIRARLLDRARQNPKLDWLYAALYPSYVHFQPGPKDVKHVVEGLKLAGTVLLEAGAQKVMPNSSFKFLEFGQEQYRARHGSSGQNGLWSSLDDLQKNPDLLLLGSAHPQGGNAISKNPAKGVVDENFRVHGCANVYVTDASVFPSSVGVNPQLTVMALAHLAAHKWIKSSAIS